MRKISGLYFILGAFNNALSVMEGLAMEKIYTYENVTIIIKTPKKTNENRLKRATKEFLTKVIKERPNYGDIDKS